MRASIRPFALLESKMFAHWAKLAEETKNAITIMEIEKGGAYDVKAVILDMDGDEVASGEYDSKTGIHAEIAAINGCGPTHHATLIVSPSPCKRCAMILAHYRKEHHFTVKAPSKSFASTYKGAYNVPDFIMDDVILDGLVKAGIINPDESARYKGQIKTCFCSRDW